MKLTKILILAGALAFTSACGSDSVDTASGSGGSSNNNNNNASPSSASEEITADEGGEISLADGATLVIPAGALDEDTTITVESEEPASGLPDANSVQGLTYNFGPDGTTFNEPVELTLPLVGDPGADQEVVISWLNEETDRWEDLTATTSGDEVTAEIEHFTLFVVRFKGVEQGAFTCEFDDSCSGGDLVGEWTIQGGCVDIPNPFEAFCATATFDVESTMEGSVTFNDDGTYSSSITSGGIFHVVIPASCLQGATGTCVEALDVDSGEDGGSTWDCTGSPEEGCDCTVTGESEVSEDTGSYETDGNQLTMTDDDDMTPDTMTYCVTGDSFKAESIEEEGDGGTPTTIIWSATR